MDWCPTGFTVVETPPKHCTGTPGLIVDYDLTFIVRPFTNFGSGGAILDAFAAPDRSSSFADVLPYNLRGSYFNGVNAGIGFGSLLIAHSFTMGLWVYAAEITGK
jgi:hypothetical protein